MKWLYEKKMERLPKPAILKAYFNKDIDENTTLAGLAEFDADSMTAEQIKAYQNKAVQDIVQYAYDKSPFYQEKMRKAGIRPEDIQEISDLSLLPLTGKDDLRGRPWDLLACPKEDIALIQVSTGTTGGEEIYIMNTWRDYFLNELAPGYPHLVPVKRGDICINALPYEMSSSGLSFHKIFMNGCDATVVPTGKGGAYSTPEKTIKLMRDLQPTIIITTPSWSMNLAEAAAESGFDLRTLPLKKMWLTGEGCSAAFRERVEKIWGTVANFYYGSLEAGGIGVECDHHNGYHLSQAHMLVEIVDPATQKVLEPGEIGEIVVSCLLRYDTPLLRYRTLDLGYIDVDPCPCGIMLPRLFLRGRKVDEVVIQGIPFSPIYLEEFLLRMPEIGNWFQFVVTSDGEDTLRIRCELASGIEATQELADSLASRMEFAIGLPCEFEIMDRIPRVAGKTVRVVHE
ncbi:AMP-dependent synthetase/ligase [Syntrophomonas zehnderi OL-4]|uniref:AMP-dependent synthetase/ligase n=1 Tax=Syntrophomonas zehnderi OL-4 TaxID=690567 RepID=A0A0E4C917_9FIRM|nr:AMP-binding protein [Syntrophomonas zehnderi]CFX78041.1 AMP-dependent synthetase/ligase [Syntrophomonas zehnderi OL-4]